jgi:hypothetical protein
MSAVGVNESRRKAQRAAKKKLPKFFAGVHARQLSVFICLAADVAPATRRSRPRDLRRFLRNPG